MLPALLAACVFVGYVTVFVAQRRMIAQIGGSSRAVHYYLALRDGSRSKTIQEAKDDQNTIPSAFSDAGPLAQDIREEDRKFLDDLVRKQYQDGNLVSAPVENIGKVETIESSGKSVPRAELVINSEIVRRGELVVHSGTVKRKRQYIPQ
jgi:hypothetical protein